MSAPKNWPAAPVGGGIRMKCRKPFEAKNQENRTQQ